MTCKIVLDADGLIKLGKAKLLALFLESFEVLVPEAVYEEAVTIGKLELYEDAFDLEEILKQGRVRILEVRLDPRVSELLTGVTALGRGERAALQLYHAENADAILSDDRVFLRFLNDNHVPYLTPAGVIARLVEIGHLAPEDGINGLERLKGSIRESVYRKVREELETRRGDNADE